MNRTFYKTAVLAALFIAAFTLPAKAWKSKGKPVTAPATETSAPVKSVAPKKTYVRRAAKNSQKTVVAAKQDLPADDTVPAEETADGTSENALDTPETQAEPDIGALADSMIATTATGDAFPEKSKVIAAEDKEAPLPLNTASPTGLEKNATSADAGYLKLTLWTLVVILVIAGLAAAMRYLQTKAGLFPSNGKLKVISQQMVSTRSKILIVEALGKRYLLGATHENISMLADLDFFAAEAPREEPVETDGDSADRDDRFELARIAGAGSSQHQETLVRDSLPEAAGAALRIKEKLKNLKKLPLSK